VKTIFNREFRLKMHPRKIRLLSYATIILVLLVYCFVPGRQEQSFRQTASAGSVDGRPVMHTFYEKTAVGEDDLLEAWKEEWTKVGFDAKVLTLEDAKRHKYYVKMEEALSQTLNGMYDQMCFYRWLAMATSGGGWMCDYDTFPTNFPMDEMENLPNKGKFTSFENHVPSLMSGTEKEWMRVTKLLVDAIPRIPARVKSDMHAFLVLKDEKKHKVNFRNAMGPVFPYKNKLYAEVPRELDCKQMEEGRAVHISHSYVKRAHARKMFPLKINSVEAMLHRGEAARVFMADWNEQCGGSNV